MDRPDPQIATNIGTREANGRFRGAQASNRDIFVYRVENEALESDIESHVKDNGIVPRSAETVSHADAMYKSRYRTTQSSKWREPLPN